MIHCLFSTKRPSKLNFHNVDYDTSNVYFLLTNLNFLLNERLTVNDAYDTFLNALRDAISIYSTLLRKIACKHGYLGKM